MDVKKYIIAQESENAYERVLSYFETGTGELPEDWGCYIFPTIQGVDQSFTGRYYALNSLIEAKVYWSEEILRDRLTKIAEVISYKKGIDKLPIQQHDKLRIKACFTLFDLIEENNYFEQALNFSRHDGTIVRVRNEYEKYRRLWVPPSRRIDDWRPLLDCLSAEAKRYSVEERITEIMRLWNSGIRMVDMVGAYAFRESADYKYRWDSGAISTINSYLNKIFRSLERPGYYDELKAQFKTIYRSEISENDEDDFMGVAQRFDFIIQTLLDDPTTHNSIQSMISGTYHFKPSPW